MFLPTLTAHAPGARDPQEAGTGDSGERVPDGRRGRPKNGGHGARRVGWIGMGDLNRAGWKPTVYDRPDDWRQFESCGLYDRMVVSGPRADGTWSCFVTRSVTETCHATPEAAAIAAERMRDAMRAAPEAVRLLAKLLPHVGDTARMEDIEKACDLVRAVNGGAR